MTTLALFGPGGKNGHDSGFRSQGEEVRFSIDAF